MQSNTSYPPILVTGGAGYIGAQVVRELLRTGRRAIVVDDLSSGTRRAVPEGATFIKADLGDRNRIEEILQNNGVEEVMHLAALVDVEESIRNRERYYDVNAAKTKVLVEAAITAGVKSFIFSSTAAVYGNTAQKPVDEEAPLRPENPYGVSKLHAELIVQKAAVANGMHYAILRYFNVAGADPAGLGGRLSRKLPTNLVTVAVRVARGWKDHLEIYGTKYETPDGTCIRDYVHVADIARAHLAALRFTGEGKSGVFNVGTGQGHSVLDVVAVVKEASGKQVPLRYMAPRPGDPARSVARVEKLKELGWQADYDLKDMIEDELRWTPTAPAHVEP